MPATEWSPGQATEWSPGRTGERATGRAGELSASQCRHCGLPVPSALLSVQGPSFCCAGCKTVFELLQEANLAQYYERRTEPTRKPVTLDNALRFARFDQPEFEERSVRVSDTDCSVELGLEGLHCAACVWLIERLPRLEPAIEEARVDLSQRTLFLRWRPAQAKLSQIAARLENLGYTPTPLVAGHARESLRRDRRELVTKMGVAFASAGNAMLMAFALYSADFGDGAGTMSHSYRRLFEVGSLVVSLPALWASTLFFRGAISALRLRTAHMDLPIALGITAAYSYGVFGVLVPGHDLYFDSITTLIFLLLFGRYLQNKHQAAHADALELAATVTPQTGRRLAQAHAIAGSGTEVPTSELTVGDFVEVLAGEALPVDGRVASGQSDLDLALLSGEATPVSVGPGDLVFAGGTNQTRRIVVEVLRTAADSRATQLMRSVEQALRTRAPLLLTIDRWAAPFTWALLVVAALTFVGAALGSGVAEGVRRTLAVLVIACPCALSMATPLALNAAIGQGARERILIKGTATLETLGHPALIVFDKTGTLTEGKLRVIEARGDAGVLDLVREAESNSNHPVARALSRDLPREAGRTERVRLLGVTEKPGLGLELSTNAGTYWVGSERYLASQGIAVAAFHLVEPECQRSSSLSPVLIGSERGVEGVVWLDDPVREGARFVLEQLRGLGHQLCILSGDRPEAVARVRRALDPDGSLFEFAEGSASPEEKLARIRGLTQSGPKVVMIGDGVNDAGALAQAHVGVAVSGAAEASMLSADVYLAHAGLERILQLFMGARRTLRTIRRGLLISLAYNLVSVALAAAGWIGPLWAAVLMPLSSISVVTNAYRSRSFAGRGGRSLRTEAPRPNTTPAPTWEIK